jgi:hypothetical protein
MQHDLIGLGHVRCDELDTRFQQATDEVNIPGKPVQLGDYQRGPVLSASFKGKPKLRTAGQRVAAFPALDLYELGRERPGPSLKVSCDRFSLRF